jgi:hypothetical protein
MNAIRPAIRAGTFYEASPDACRRHVENLFEQASLPPDLDLPVCGGLAPHAGWIFSGALAARTVAALVRPEPPETFVLFGADHSGVVSAGEVYDRGAWESPLGEMEIDEELARELLEAGGPLRSNPAAHASEHSLEVQVPLLMHAAPRAKILPIAVPPDPEAVQIGREVGRVLADRGGTARLLGSTDLSHHGGHFPAPGGRGPAGEKFTAENDRRMLDLVERMDAEGVIGEARERLNACGAGAIAATIAACRELGATAGRVLEYTNSYRVVHAHRPDDPDDTTVGYASVVFL